MTRWWWLPATALVLAGVSAGTWAVLRDEPTPDLTGQAAVTGTPDEQAALACVRVELALKGIRADSAAGRVLEEVARARVLAQAAAGGDPRWVSLAGGVGALEQALRTDDAQAASVAVRVAQAECGAP